MTAEEAEKVQMTAMRAKATLPQIIALLKLVADALKSLGMLAKWLFPRYTSVVDRIENAITQLENLLVNL